MAKINKVYPSFFNGVTQQTAELSLDNQCKAMVNCIPDLVTNLQKRPPVEFTSTITNSNDHTLVHSYDRGEDNEEYFFLYTNNSTDPLRIFNKNGTEMVVEYEGDTTTVDSIKSYLNTEKLKGLTVQDRTWIVNKENVVTVNDDGTPLYDNFDKSAYYWLKRGSGDSLNPYRYAVYINGETFEATNDNSDTAATSLAASINDGSLGVIPDYIRAVAIGSIVKIYMAEIHAPDFRVHKGYTASNLVTPKTSTNTFVRVRDPQGTVYGLDVTDYVVSYNLIELGWELYCSINGVAYYYNLVDEAPTTIGVPYYSNTSHAVSNTSPDWVYMSLYQQDLATVDFTFSSWDSWGNQASEGWKQKVNKITDLPKDMPFENVYVEITGDEGNDFTTYYVKWNGSSWEECLNPKDSRGSLNGMPIKIDRTSLVSDIATFTVALEEWSLPIVGNTENNSDPSFVGYKIQDIFFYKNRLGIASAESVVLSRAASYTNFYVQTVVDILDTDPIDVAIASNQASNIYHVKPFNNSLYIFTKYSQFELTYDGAFSPKTVNISNATNYPMAVDVEPKVVNNSLYFISTTGGRQQLREYIKNEKLSVQGVDLNLSTPTYLDKPIKSIQVNGVLGFVLCCTASNEIYLYNYKEDGNKRVQSAWSKWLLLNDVDYQASSFEYAIIDATLLVFTRDDQDYIVHSIQLDSTTKDNKIDTTKGSVTATYPASVKLPDFYPHITGIGTPLNKVLLKKAKIQGTGNFDVVVYRKDYNRTFVKPHTSSSVRDLDVHINSKVGNVDITIQDETVNDFVISSVVLEGLYTATSKEIK
jgi:hypothetical protein